MTSKWDRLQLKSSGVEAMERLASVYFFDQNGTGVRCEWLHESTSKFSTWSLPKGVLPPRVVHDLPAASSVLQVNSIDRSKFTAETISGNQQVGLNLKLVPKALYPSNKRQCAFGERLGQHASSIP